MPERCGRGRASSLVDACFVWVIAVIAYAVVGFLRAKQLVREAPERLRSLWQTAKGMIESRDG